MNKRTIIDKIEVDSIGVIGVRLACQVIDGDSVIANHWHRTVIPPGINVEDQMAVVNAHLAAGIPVGGAVVTFPPVSDLNELASLAEIIQTPERVASYQASLSASVE